MLILEVQNPEDSGAIAEVEFESEEQMQEAVKAPDWMDQVSSMFSTVVDVVSPVSEAKADTTPQEPFGLLKQGSADKDNVGIAQDLLGMDVGEDRGIFGPKTRKAVVEFQKQHGLETDGIIGAKTWTKLRETTEPVESTFIPEPIKFVASSLTGSKLTEQDMGDDTLAVIRQAAQTARSKGREWVDYSDYPDLKRGISAAALVGNHKGNPELKEKYTKEREEAYPMNPIGAARLIYDLFTDPVVKASLSVGGFSIQKGDTIKEKFNFNTINKSEGDWYSWLRKTLSESGIMGLEEDEGPSVEIKL